MHVCQRTSSRGAPFNVETPRTSHGMQHGSLLQHPRAVVKWNGRLYTTKMTWGRSLQPSMVDQYQYERVHFPHWVEFHPHVNKAKQSMFKHPEDPKEEFFIVHWFLPRMQLSLAWKLEPGYVFQETQRVYLNATKMRTCAKNQTDARVCYPTFCLNESKTQWGKLWLRQHAVFGIFKRWQPKYGSESRAARRQYFAVFIHLGSNHFGGTKVNPRVSKRVLCA